MQATGHQARFYGRGRLRCTCWRTTARTLEPISGADLKQGIALGAVEYVLPYYL
jgi:hypothetical protein